MTINQQLDPRPKPLVMRNIFLSYLIRLPLTGFVIAQPVIYLWWQKHGIGVTRIATLISVFSVLLVLFEIPSGYIADQLSRKSALAFGALCLAAGATIFAITGSFTPLVVAELCFALGLSLISGSDQAILFDSLITLGRQNEFTRIWGNIRTFDLIAGASLTVVGGYLGRIDLRIPFIVAAVLFCLLVVIVIAFVEPLRLRTDTPSNPLKDIAQAVHFCLWKSRATAWLLTFSAVAFSFSGSVDTYSQFYLSQIGAPVHHVGWLLGATTLAAAIAAKACFKIDQRIGFSGSVLLIICLIVIGLIGLGLVPSYYGLVFFLMPYFQRGYNGVGIARYINDTVVSEVRAMALSLSNMIGRLATAIIVPGFGYLIDTFGIFTAFKFFSLFALPIFAIMFVLRPRLLTTRTSGVQIMEPAPISAEGIVTPEEG